MANSAISPLNAKKPLNYIDRKWSVQLRGSFLCLKSVLVVVFRLRMGALIGAVIDAVAFAAVCTHEVVVRLVGHGLVPSM